MSNLIKSLLITILQGMIVEERKNSRRDLIEMEGFKGKWLQTSAELYDEFLKVSS